MKGDLNTIKGAISAIEGMLKMYEPLKHADEALTALGNLEANRKVLGPQVEKLKEEKKVAEGELDGVRKETESAKFGLKKNVEKQVDMMKEWLAQEKKKVEEKVASHEKDLYGRLKVVNGDIKKATVEYEGKFEKLQDAQRRLIDVEKMRADKEKEHVMLSEKVEKLKAEMRKLGGV